MSPRRLWLFRVQREADSIGPIKVAKQSLTGQRQKGHNKTKHPYPEQDGDGASPAGSQVVERIHDADVFLQSEVSEEQDRDFSGQHGQRADDLTLTAVHPGLSVPVVLASKLQVIRTDHEEVDAHQPICTCTAHRTRNGLIRDVHGDKEYKYLKTKCLPSKMKKAFYFLCK